MVTTLLVLSGYLVGSLSFAVIVSRFMRLPDPHTYGSGNPGATNVLRTGNKRAAVLTLVGDSLKGLLVVLVVKALAASQGFDSGQVALAGLGAFLGHLFPAYFGFRGGKGVATAAGVLFGLNGWLGLSVLGVWLLAFAVTRISSVGALAAAVAAPAVTFGLLGTGVPLLCVIVMSGLLVWRHRENIRKLRAGVEGKVKSGA